MKNARNIHFALTSFTQALSLLRSHARLRKLFFIPALIQFLSFIFCFVYLLGKKEMFIAAVPSVIRSEIPNWLQQYILPFLSYVLPLVFFAVAALASILISMLIIGLLSDTIARASMQYTAPEIEFNFISLSLFRSIILELVVFMRQLFIFILGYLCICFITLIPIIGSLLTPILHLYWSSLFLAAQFANPAYSVFAQKAPEREKAIAADSITWSFFGLIVSLLMWIPFTVPYFVIAASVLHCKISNSAQQQTTLQSVGTV